MMTEWFPPEITPVHVGWYEVAGFPEHIHMLYWDGIKWMQLIPWDGFHLAYCEFGWRGLTERQEERMLIEDVIEHEDGSATMTFHLTDEEKTSLIQYAILDILTKAANGVIKTQNGVTSPETVSES